VIRELDYERLKKSLAFFVDQYTPPRVLTPETHPIRVLECMEKERMTMARRGLAIAIADMIEGTQDFSVTQVRVADREMQKLGACALSFLRSRFTRRRGRYM
jgi:hypothetical protein